MTPKYLSVCVKLMVFLMFVFSTSSTPQCTPKKTERDGHVIKNIGIKMCELKCVEYGQCLSIEYNQATLTCRLSTDASTKIKKKEGYVIRARDHSQEVITGACTSSKCSFGQQCLETRSGKSVCVQDEKQNNPENPPQHKFIKQETSIGGSLRAACWMGDLDRAGYILSQGLVDINSRDKKHGKTPLMVAALQINSGMFVFRTNKGDNTSVVGNDNKNILHWACKGNLLGTMFKCVLQQYNINTNAEETPFLVQPSFRGNRDPYNVLVCMGAKVSAHYRGKSVLNWACKSGHIGIFRFLLVQRIVDINSRTEVAWTPLMMTIEYGYSDVFDSLIGMGANLSQVDLIGRNALHFACRFGRLCMVKYLVSNGSIDINGRTQFARTPLMMTVEYGHSDVFDFLIGMGANLSQVDFIGTNALHFACSFGRLGMVKYLVSNGSIDINGRTNYGWTPLMFAGNNSHIDVFELLIDMGANVSHVNVNGNNILHLASENGHVQIVKYILSHNLVDINAKNKHGETAAIMAKRHHKLNIYNLLVSGTQ